MKRSLAVSRRPVQQLLGLAVIGGVVALAGACAAPSPAASPQATTAATNPPAAATAAPKVSNADPNARVTFLVNSIAGTLDPFQGAGNPNVVAVRAVFDTAVSLDNGAVIGNLLQSWRNVTPTQWELKLKPNIRFANGDASDAENFVTLINYVVDPRNQAPIASAVNAVANAELVDPLTVRINSKAPASDTVIRMSSLQVAPMKAVLAMGRDEFGVKPIGSSLWTVTSFRPSQELLLTARDGSWRGNARFKELRIVANATPTVRDAALRTGEADIVDQPSPEGYRVLLGDKFGVFLDQQGVTYGIYFDTLLPGSPVKAKEVRQALNFAVDKKAAIQSFDPTANEVGQYGYPGLPGWVDAIKAFPYDPVRARSLLAQGGQPNGFSSKMHISSQGDGLVAPDVAVYVQAEMRKIGVNLEIDSIDTATISRMFFEGGYHPLRLTALGYNDMATEFGYHLCPVGDTGKSIRGYPARFCDPDLDRLFIAASSEFDTAKRTALLQQMNQTLHDNPVQLYLGNPANVTMFTGKIEGFRKLPGGYTQWQDVIKNR